MNLMKKIIAVLIASAMAGSALASTVGQGPGASGTGAVVAYTGQLTIAAEALQTTAYTLDLDTATASPAGTANTGAIIRYVPSFGLNAGDIITFTFTNALYMDADVFLVGEEGTARQALGNLVIDGSDFADVIEVASNFGTLDAVNGVSIISLRINNGLTLPSGIELVLQATNAGLEQTGDGVLNNFAANPTIRIAAGLPSTSTVSIASTGVTSGNIPIPAATNSNDGIIADVLTQFTLTTVTATSTIDVGAAVGARQNFLEELNAGQSQTVALDDTDLTTSSGTYTFGNDAGNVIEDFIVLDNGDIATMTLVSSTNIDAIPATAGVITAGSIDIEADGLVAAGSLVGNGLDVDFVVNPVGSTTTLTAALLGGGIALTQLRAAGGSQTDNVSITIDGTTVILDRTWTLSGSLVMDADVIQTTAAVYALTGGITHTWTTNGTVLEATYVNTNVGFNNRFVLANTGGTDAPYTATCQVEAGNICTIGTGGAGTLVAGETLVLNSADVITVTGTGNLNRATVIFTVEAPNNVIQGITQVVKPATGIEASHPMVRPGTN